MSLGTPADAIVRDQIIIGQYSVGDPVTSGSSWLTPDGDTYKMVVVGDSFAMDGKWAIECLFDGWVRFEAWVAFSETDTLSRIAFDFVVNDTDPATTRTNVEVLPKALGRLTNIRVARDIEVSADDVVELRFSANQGTPDVTVHGGTFRAKRIRA